MITILEAIILGLLQGISELFPISSLGHSILVPALLGWNLHSTEPYFLTFLVATHLATATVLFIFFWRDWQRVITGIIRSLRQRQIADPDAKLGWLLIVGTIPAGILGLLFDNQIRSTLVTARSAALFLTLNGLLLFGAEYLRRRATPITDGDGNGRIAKLSWRQAFKIGAVQALALVPGLSRSGSSMAGGLLEGLSNEDAAHFGFLLATPIIAAAAVLKLPELAQSQNRPLLAPALVGALAAALGAYVAVKFLVRYFKNNSLRPFAIYCVLAGIFCLIFVR